MLLKYFSKATNNKLTRQNTQKNQIFFIYKNGKDYKIKQKPRSQDQNFQWYSLHVEFTRTKEIQNREGH